MYALNRSANIEATSITMRNCLFLFWVVSEGVGPIAWIPMEQEAMDRTDTTTTKISVTTDIYYCLENVILKLMYRRSIMSTVLNTIHIIK